MTHRLYRNPLFSFKVLGDFSVIFLLRISSFVPLWLSNALGIISILLHLWTKIWWCILVCIPWTLEKCVICSSWVQCSIKTDLILWVGVEFCVAALSIVESIVLMYSLWVCLIFQFDQFCFMYFTALLFVT